MVKLAALTGYTKASAQVTFGNIKRKLKSTAPVTGGTMPNITPKKAGGPGRGKTGTPGSNKKRGADSDDSPSKKTKATPKKGKKLADDDDDEFSLPKIKKEELGDIVNDADAFYQQPVATTEGAGMMANGGGLDLGDHGSCSGPHGLIDMDDDDDDNY